MNKRKHENNRQRAPLLRVRHLAGITAIISFLIAGPLGIVWKQVYITQNSVRQNRLSDSLVVLNKQAAQLRLNVEKLSGTARIESIARKCLGLEYPAASQIVIIKPHSTDFRSPVAGDTNNYMAILRRSIAREKG